MFIIQRKEITRMRWLSGLLIALVISLLAMALPAAPAQGADGAYIHLSPSQGVPGEEVTVYGYNFTAEQYIDIYYDGLYRTDVETDEEGDFEATFFVPESSKGYHTVLADEYGSTVSASADFRVEPGLTVSPEQGPVGTNVTVQGRGFAADEDGIEVYFDGEMVAENLPPANEDGSWEMTFTIPRCAQGRHQIDAKGDSSSLAQVEDAAFEVTAGISLARSSGSPRQRITMTGSGFAARERDIRILFDGEETDTDPDIIRADDTGYWQAIFEVPERPKGTYGVTAEGEWTPKEDVSDLSFEIGTGLVLSPDEGHVGTELTVTGGGFEAHKNVVIRYDGGQAATAETGARGSFVVSFAVPESRHGGREVTAEIAGEVEAIAVFTMESDSPDTPEPVSPVERDRGGFIGKVRPTFEWTGVEDLSGVYYTLQISTSANVTATGFFSPVVSVSGIVGTNYTLDKTQGLSYGTYYWIVQAVDGAENAGNWTEPISFRAGVMPLWAFIVIIVAVVAGIGTALYFFVIRKRLYYL